MKKLLLSLMLLSTAISECAQNDKIELFTPKFLNKTNLQESIRTSAKHMIMIPALSILAYQAFPSESFNTLDRLVFFSLGITMSSYLIQDYLINKNMLSNQKNPSESYMKIVSQLKNYMSTFFTSINTCVYAIGIKEKAQEAQVSNQHLQETYHIALLSTILSWFITYDTYQKTKWLLHPNNWELQSISQEQSSQREYQQSDQCYICLETIQDLQKTDPNNLFLLKPCEHIVCKTCVNGLKARNQNHPDLSCGICRKKVEYIQPVYTKTIQPNHN